MSFMEGKELKAVYFYFRERKYIGLGQTCIQLYRGIQDNLGLYMFSKFSLIQFIWMDSLFLALSLPIKSKMKFLPLFLHSLGNTVQV